MRISTDDLLRLAHMIGPTTANPLAFSFEEDPELRKMFHVKEPLASEGPLDTESNIVETPTATASPSASPGAERIRRPHRRRRARARETSRHAEHAAISADAQRKLRAADRDHAGALGDNFADAIADIVVANSRFGS